MKQLFTSILLAITLLTGFSSCFATRNTIGYGPVGREAHEVFSKSKRLYLFWGLVPLGLTQPPYPPNGNFQIKSANNVGDAIIGFITLGIISSRTTRILVKKGELSR